MLIQKLRLKQGWSQQQLATASGLSARTIQRIEAGFPPSMDSLKSIAGAFDIDFEELVQNPVPTEITMAATESKVAVDLEAEAFSQVRELRKFYLNLMRYLIIILLLIVVNYFTSPHYPWVLWVIGGWGIGLVSQAVRVLKPQLFLGPQWERKEVEKRLGRSL